MAQMPRVLFLSDPVWVTAQVSRQAWYKKMCSRVWRHDSLYVLSLVYSAFSGHIALAYLYCRRLLHKGADLFVLLFS